MKAFQAQLQSLKQQADAAPWLKWAGLLIAVLLAVFALQGLDGWRTARQKSSIEAEQNLRRILALKGQDVWLTRKTNAQQLRDALEAQIPKVATPGMAQASLQSWLKGIVSKFDTKHGSAIQINRSAPVENMPDILRVNATLNGGYSPRQALVLLRQIESAPNLVVVETLTLQSGDNSTLHLSLNAYYRISAGAHQ